MARREVFISNQQDKILQAPSKDGAYINKHGYNVVRCMVEGKPKCRSFSFCWNFAFLPKASYFS